MTANAVRSQPEVLARICKELFGQANGVSLAISINVNHRSYQRSPPFSRAEHHRRRVSRYQRVSWGMRLPGRGYSSRDGLMERENVSLPQVPALYVTDTRIAADTSHLPRKRGQERHCLSE